jgi:hypothetical protein
MAVCTHMHYAVCVRVNNSLKIFCSEIIIPRKLISLQEFTLGGPQPRKLAESLKIFYRTVPKRKKKQF